MRPLLAWPAMRAPRVALVVAGVVLVAAVALVVRAVGASGASNSDPSVTTVSLTMPHAYKPVAAPGTTDDYHCTLVNPRLTHDSYIVSSQFIPGSAEDHHAALFLVPPSSAAAVERDDDGGKGWTCFGGPLPGTALVGLAADPLLTFWAPGAGADDFPKGTGVFLRAGSLVIMQVHYNLLVGDSPVKNSLVLHTVPATTPLLPLKLDLMPAPPDVPCPAGVSGPLCNRAASLANLGHRFGQSAVDFVNTLESVCGRNPADPPQGDSTSCDWPIYRSGYIVRAGAHMHLLGATFKMVLDPGTPEAKTILDVPDYNFHYQRAYDLKTPIEVTRGDMVQVTCTYDPTLSEELPALRKLPPHFVTWGDGSSDEMCLGLMWESAELPNPNYPV